MEKEMNISRKRALIVGAIVYIIESVLLAYTSTEFIMKVATPMVSQLELTAMISVILFVVLYTSFLGCLCLIGEKKK